ncbi:MAG: hypothetical protein JOZ47_03740 [Kutzneria sp.]|nr:hypothetical protein [Kutzneria sp.]
MADTVQQRHDLVESDIGSDCARLLTANQEHSATFIGVLTVHDGKITLWREYQNTPAIMRALG